MTRACKQSRGFITEFCDLASDLTIISIMYR